MRVTSEMSYKMKQKVMKSSFSTPSLPLGGVWVATVVILIVGIGGTHAQPTVSISTETPIEDAHLLEAPYLMFPHIYRAFIHAGRNPGQYNVTVECQGDLILYFKGLNKKKGWAWRCKYNVSMSDVTCSY